MSLYNETAVQREGGGTVSVAILPTPTVAAVGLVHAKEDVVRSAFQRAGDDVLLLGEASSQGVRALGASEWLVRKLGKLAGEAPALDLEAEARLQKLVLGLARAHLLSSAHDVSDGGLAVALAECCAVAGATVIGAKVELTGVRGVGGDPVDAVAALFGEGPSRVIASVSPASVAAVLERAAAAGVPARRIGTTGGDRLAIEAAPLRPLSLGVRELRAKADACLESIVGA